MDKQRIKLMIIDQLGDPFKKQDKPSSKKSEKKKEEVTEEDNGRNE